MDQAASTPPGAAGNEFQALSPRLAATVIAAAARIFPTTSTPGATEAGAVYYIDRLLTEAYPELLALYRGGCRALDRHARSRFAQPFAALPEDQQDQALTDFEHGRVTGYRKASEFFETLRRHTMEGVLGEPSYGGNRDMVGWRVVGFPGQQFGYPDAYINRTVDLEPVAMEGIYPREEALRVRDD